MGLLDKELTKLLDYYGSQQRVADELGLSRSHFFKVRTQPSKWPPSVTLRKLVRALCLLIEHGDGYAPKKGGKISL